jgi:diacylglycerol kinase
VIKSSNGVKDFFKSFVFAFRGIRASLKEQRNLKVQILVAVLTVGAGFYFKIASWEWCVVLITIGLVISLEMINTSIELLVDLVTRERKPQAGRIKDVAAGAVLVVSIIAIIVGLIVFRKYLID